MKKMNSTSKTSTPFLKWLFLKIFLLLLTFMPLGLAFAQTTQTFSTSGTFTVPAGVTSITVSAWGGGGAGGGVDGNGSGRAGGGGEGGSFVRGTLTVVPSATYTVVVGNGGLGVVSANGGAGQSSSFSVPAGATLFNAIGGTFGAAGFSFGAGGNAINTGNIVSGTTTSNFYGGNGGTATSASTASSGGGGGSAGAGGGGGNGGSPLTGGAAGTGSGVPLDAGIVGATGRGSSNDGDGIDGGAPGAGGSGARNANNTTNYQGGDGGNGRVNVTYTCPTYALTAAATATGPFCGASTSVVTLRSSTLPSGTYIVTYNLSAPNVATGNTANMVFTAGSPGTGTFTTSSLSNPGTTTVTVTDLDNANCGSTVSSNNTVTVSIAISPTAVAGTAINTCSNSAAVNITAGSSASNAATTTWTSSGTGTFANANSLTTCTYTPSATDISVGSVTLTLTSTPNSPCVSNATSNKTLTINQAPTSVAGTAVLTCSSTGAINITAGSSASNNASVTWSTTNGTGSFANATSLTTCTYTPSAADISAGNRNLVLTAIALAGCTNATSNKSITITAAATAVAGTAITTCSNSGAVNITTGSTSTNNAGVTWTCNGTGTFTNPNSLTLCTYTPSAADIAAGSRTLTLTATGNSPCGNVVSTKTITINQLPTANAGTAVTTCSSTGAVNITAGSSAGNQASVTWTSSGTGTFANANSLTTCTYTPSGLDISAGSVTLTLTANGNAGCSNVTSTKSLTIVTAATAVAGTAISNCAYPGVAVNVTAGSSSTNNNGITWTCNGSGTFANANSLTTCTYTPSAADIAAGSRTLTLTASGNSPCGNVSSTKTITFVALPSAVSVTPSTATVCASATSTALAGAATTTATSIVNNDNFNGTPTYIGSGSTTGNRSQIFSQETSGTTVNSVSTFTSPNGGGIMLALAAASGVIGTSTSSANTLLTSPAINTNNFTALTLTYHHTYKQGNSGSPSGKIEVSTNGSTWTTLKTFTTNQGGATSFVADNITLSNTYLNQSNLQLRFNFVSSNSSSFSANSSWWAIDDVLLNGVPVPLFSWTSNTGSGIDGLPGGAGTPSIANKNITVVPTATTIYTVTATDQVTGCTSTSTATVTVNPAATVSAGSTQTICSNQAATMNGAFGGAATSATWSTSGTGTFNNNNIDAIYTPSLADITAGSVVLTYTTNDPTGPCGSVNASMTLNINKIPTISSHPANVIVCENGNATFTVGATGAGLSYQWRKGTTDLVNGGTISGALTASLTITGVVVGDAASDYNCVVSGTCAPSVTSNNATLTVNTSPLISSNGNISANTSGSCIAAITNGQLLAQVSFSGSPTPTVTFNPAAGNFNVGTTTVTATAQNTCGSVQTTFDVIITDNENPVVTCPATANITADAGLCSSSASIGTATATDNCSVASVVASPAGPYAVGTHTITWTATDASGNTATCNQTVNVTDNENPVISNCPSNINWNADAGQCDAVVVWTAPTANDNCGMQSFMSTHNSGDTFPIGATTVTYTATDIHGNTSTCVFIVNVIDDQDPVITCPATADLTADAGSCSSSTFIGTATATDNCAGTTVAASPAGPYPVGTTIVTWTATDASGNTATCTQTVNVVDTEIPVINVCPSNITVSNDAGTCGAVVNYTAPTASDNCAGATINGTHNSGDTFPLGTTTVTYTAMDASGNSAVACSFTVTVNSSAPSAPATATANAPFNNICNGNNVQLTANGGDLGSMGGAYKWYTGSCGSTLVGTGATITQSPSVTTTYFVRVEDNCGNVTSCVSVTVTLSYIPDSANVILPFTGMPSNVCTGTTANLSIAPVPGATYYVWDVPSGGYFNGNTSNVSPFTTATPNVQVTYGAPIASLYATGVQAGNACGTSVRKQQKSRGTTSVPASVSGPLTGCPNSSITYSTAHVTGATSYLWTITGNATVIGTTTTVTVNFGPSWNGGTLCVSAQTTCYTSPSKCITISRSASITNTISGTFTACPGSVLNYSVAPSSGAASYNWTVPVNASVTNGQGTSSPTVTFASNYNNVGSICVTVTSICGVTSPAKCKSVAPGLPTIPNSINGPANGLCGQTVVFTCPNQTGATFVWSVPTGATIQTGQGSNSISVIFGSFTTGALSVKATNACGSSGNRTITVKGAPNKPTSIVATPSSWCDNTDGIEFVANTSGISGSYTMTWSFPSAPVANYVFGGGNSNSLVMDWLSGNGTILATSFNACGSGTAVLNIGSACREAQVNSKEQMLSVFPNPSTGLINISYQSLKENTSIIITDLAGRTMLVKKTESVEGNNNVQLDLTKFAKGAYMLGVKTSDGIKQVKIMVE